MTEYDPVAIGLDDTLGTDEMPQEKSEVPKVGVKSVTIEMWDGERATITFKEPASYTLEPGIKELAPIDGCARYRNTGHIRVEVSGWRVRPSNDDNKTSDS